MAKNMILAMIREKCREDKISQKQLCKGICDPAYLSRCIKDNIEMDKLMMDALMQRLGISTRRYSHILNNSEYEFFRLRESIRTAIKEKEVNLISRLIQQYVEQISPLRTGKRLHMQVALFFRSYELALENVDCEKQLNNIKYALECTGITTEALDEPMALFSEVELLLFLRYGMVIEQKGEEERAREVYKKLYLLCERDPYNNGELIHVFAAVAYHLSKSYMSEGNYEQVLNLSRETLKNLSKMNKFLFAKEFMRFYSWAEKESGRLDEAFEYCHHYDSISIIIEEYYQDWNPNTYCPMFYERNIYSLKNMVKARRKLKGLTREELAEEGYCNVATIERLERGVGDTQGDIGYRLLNVLGLPIEKCFFEIITESYQMRELFARIETELDRKEVSVAKEYLEQLKKEIDLALFVNRQCIEYNEFRIECLEHSISEEDKIVRRRDLLEITLPLKFLNEDSEGMLYGNEETLVENIAIAYEKIGQIEKGIDLLKKVIKKYKENENVSNYLRFSRELESMLANVGEFEESNKIIETGIEKTVYYDFVGLLIPFLYDKVWNKDKQNQELSHRELDILDSAWILSIYSRQASVAKQIERYFKILKERVVNSLD